MGDLAWSSKSCFLSSTGKMMFCFASGRTNTPAPVSSLVHWLLKTNNPIDAKFMMATSMKYKANILKQADDGTHAHSLIHNAAIFLYVSWDVNIYTTLVGGLCR